MRRNGRAAALAPKTYVSVAVVVQGRRLKLHLHFDEDGGYWVDSPDLRGLVSQGETTDEAIANGVDAALALQEADAVLRKRAR